MHVWSLRIGSLFAALSLLVFGTGIAMGQTAQRMEMQDFKFVPAAGTFRVGDKIDFTLPNTGRFPHRMTVQAPGGQTINITEANVAPGATGTGSYTFAAAGTYTFWCPVGQHRANGMEGTFRVAAVGAAAGAAPASGTLPRTGGLPVGMIGGGLAGLAGLSFAVGFALRRRS